MADSLVMGLEKEGGVDLVDSTSPTWGPHGIRKEKWAEELLYWLAAQAGDHTFYLLSYERCRLRPFAKNAAIVAIKPITADAAKDSFIPS